MMANSPIPKIVPVILKEHILPFNWDVRKVWMLKADVVQIPCSEFLYLLELPLWSSVPNQGLLFDTRPIDVINSANVSVYQHQRLDQIELEHPIDVLVVHNKRWILDGVHRVAKHFILKSPMLPVRFHDESIIPFIKLD